MVTKNDQATNDLSKPDTLAALLCCLYEGPEIQLAATMLIEQAMELEELRASPVAAPEAPASERQAKCWSCNKLYTLEQRAEADGNCPHCGVEIELATPAATTTPASEQQIDALMAVHDDQLDDYLRGIGLEPAECEAAGRRALDGAIKTAATTASQSDADKLLAMRAEYDRKEGEARGTMMGEATTASASAKEIAAANARCDGCWGDCMTCALDLLPKAGRATAPSRNANPLADAIRALHPDTSAISKGGRDGYIIGFYKARDLAAALTQQSAAQAPSEEAPTIKQVHYWMDRATRAEEAFVHAKYEGEKNEQDAARYRWLCANNFDRNNELQVHTWAHNWDPHTVSGEPVEWKQRVRGGALDRVIDEAVKKGAQS